MGNGYGSRLASGMTKAKFPVSEGITAEKWAAIWEPEPVEGTDGDNSFYIRMNKAISKKEDSNELQGTSKESITRHSKTTSRASGPASKVHASANRSS